MVAASFVEAGIPPILVYEDLALDGRVVDQDDVTVRWDMDEVRGVYLLSPGDLDGDGADDLVLTEPLAFSAD